MRHAGWLPVAGAILMLAAGCLGNSSPARLNASSSPAAAKDCGTAYTAAHVAVNVQVPASGVSCAVALRVQADYASKLAAGQAPGNGGGGPVPVDGWVCEGYPTPQVLQTGRASQCKRGGVQFFAVLPAPTTPATP